MQDWLSESEKNQQLFEDLSNPDEFERQVAELESLSMRYGSLLYKR
jgi:hypothetical protein